MTNDARYIGQRTELLATMILTRDGRVVVQAPQADYGLDFIATIGGSARIFGVQVKGALDRSMYLTNESILRRKVTDQLRVFVADCTFPVAVMVVEMQHDNGYIGWLLEPSLGNDRSRLRLAKAVAMQLATSQVVHQCVDEVDRWYDARRRGNLEWS